MNITNKKLARAALLGAAIAAGIDLTPTNQAVAQVYVPTNHYVFSLCTYWNEDGHQYQGGKCASTGGNCLTASSCG